jgi:hypothetical protein
MRMSDSHSRGSDLESVRDEAATCSPNICPMEGTLRAISGFGHAYEQRLVGEPRLLEAGRGLALGGHGIMC